MSIYNETPWWDCVLQTAANARSSTASYSKEIMIQAKLWLVEVNELINKAKKRGFFETEVRLIELPTIGDSIPHNLLKEVWPPLLKALCEAGYYVKVNTYSSDGSNETLVPYTTPTQIPYKFFVVAW